MYPPNVFPAHAGVIPRAGWVDVSNQCFPRTRGVIADAVPERLAARMFSPHTRGDRFLGRLLERLASVFPAHAG